MPDKLPIDGVIGIDPLPEPESVEVGPFYYRVTGWDKDRPGLPVVPAVDKAVWRRHNLYEDVIETTEPLTGVVVLDAAKEEIPRNGIGNWTVGNFKGVERDEEAYKPFTLNAHLVKNHCVGELTYDEFQALKYYCDKFKGSKKLAEFQAANDLLRVKDEMPWGKVFSEGCPIVGLGGRLLTPDVLADHWTKIIPAPAPKVAEKHVAKGFAVDIEDRQVPLKTVEETVDLFAESRDKKVSGWSPTNAYVSEVAKDYITSAASSWTWNTDNTKKYAHTFTAASSYTLASIAIPLRAAGALTGEITVRIYAGDPTGARTTLAYGTINAIEVSTAATYYMPFGGSTCSIVSGNVYTIEISTTANISATDYLFFGYQGSGGVAGNQLWMYDGASWSSTSYRMNFITMDNSDGGIYHIRADAPSDVLFSASGAKGATIASTDKYYTFMGATLTRNSNFTCYLGVFGTMRDMGTGGTPSNRVVPSGYRYGYETISAGVTVTWTGDATINNSGWSMNPSTADTSSKECRINGLGTAANPMVCTNSVSGYNTSYRWNLGNRYGTVSFSYTTFQFYSNGGGNGGGLDINVTSANTSGGGATFYRCTFQACNTSGYYVWDLNGASADLPVNFYYCTNIMSYDGGAGSANSLFLIQGTATDGFAVVIPGFTTYTAAGGTASTCLLRFDTSAAQWYFFDNGMRYTDARFNDLNTPADFALADFESGGTLKATVAAATIAAMASNDKLVFYNSSNVEIGRCTKAVYAAALYNKPANCALITGLVNDTEYAGVYCRITRDDMLFTSISGTAGGTPTDPASGGGGSNFNGGLN